MKYTRTIVYLISVFLSQQWMKELCHMRVATKLWYETRRKYNSSASSLWNLGPHRRVKEFNNEFSCLLFEKYCSPSKPSIEGVHSVHPKKIEILSSYYPFCRFTLYTEEPGEWGVYTHWGRMETLTKIIIPLWLSQTGGGALDWKINCSTEQPFMCRLDDTKHHQHFKKRLKTF